VTFHIGRWLFVDYYSLIVRLRKISMVYIYFSIYIFAFFSLIILIVCHCTFHFNGWKTGDCSINSSRWNFDIDSINSSVFVSFQDKEMENVMKIEQLNAQFKAKKLSYQEYCIAVTSIVNQDLDINHLSI
jgi:hypothetical protein